MPKISVLMSNYNGGAFIGEAIESILQQTYTDFELIIVDDASTDKSWDIIQNYSKKDTRIVCYQNAKNIGISLTRNRLIDLAQGEYIAWLDSDDCAIASRLEKQIQFLEKHPHHGIVGSWMILIDSEGIKKGVKKLPIDDREIRKQWYMRNSLNHPGLMMRKICIEEVGYYDPEFDIAQDYDFGIRAGTKFLLANIPETLTKYRIHTHNISIKKYKKTIQETLLIRKKMRKLGYKIGILGCLAYPITWCMQFVPPKLSIFLFHAFIKVFSGKKTEVK